MADDDRPQFSGRVPASGAPLNARTLALRPGGQSLSQGDLTSSDAVANAVYNFLQAHPSLGVPQQGQENLAETARVGWQNTPWGQGEEAIKSARVGDFPGTVSGLFGATPLLGAAGGVAARVGKTAAKDATETVASNLAKRAVLTTGADAAESAAPAAAEAATPVITGRVSAGASAPPPIVAYHGSPYSFDRFDSSKIGTGEGAQAYGHGLYFSDNEGVARTYQSKVSALRGTGTATIDGNPINWDNPAEYAAFELQRHNGDRNAAADFAEQTFRNKPAAELLRSGVELPSVKFPGSMYQVGINADPNSFLDWDKPLSQQSPHVQQNLADVLRYQKVPLTNNAGGETTGGQMMGYLQNRFGNDVDAAGELSSSNIPGVKYLDQGSRAYGTPVSIEQEAGGQWNVTSKDPSGIQTNMRFGSQEEAQNFANQTAKPTSNYVLFDDSLASILKKYGLAGLGTAGGAAALTAGGQSSVSPVSPAEAAPAPLSDQQSPPDQGPPVGSDEWWTLLRGSGGSTAPQ